MSEDTSPTQSAMLEQDSPNNAGRGSPDKQGGALVIPEIEKLGEKIINETGVALKRGLTINPGGGKRRAAPGTAKRRMAIKAEKLRKIEKSSDNPEDHSQLKDPPECGMLVPVVPGLDPSVLIPSLLLTNSSTRESTSVG